MVEDDLEALGYMFAWQKLSASEFLLRQRRLRVWGVADLMNTDSKDEFKKRMKATVGSMSGTELFDFNKVFDRKLPKQALTNKLQKSKLQGAIEKARLKHSDGRSTPNVFIDTATGCKRDVESAEEVTTCIRPTHHIYSAMMERFVSVPELWCCQGLWESAFANPSAVQEIMQNPRQAQDLAGQGEEKNIYVYRFVCVCIVLCI